MRESEGGARGEADGPAYLESLQEVTVRQAGMIILLPTYQGIVMRIFVSIRGTGWSFSHFGFIKSAAIYIAFVKKHKTKGIYVLKDIQKHL